jgi:hypothetical protein
METDLDMHASARYSGNLAPLSAELQTYKGVTDMPLAMSWVENNIRNVQHPTSAAYASKLQTLTEGANKVREAVQDIYEDWQARAPEVQPYQVEMELTSFQDESELLSYIPANRGDAEVVSGTMHEVHEIVEEKPFVVPFKITPQKPQKKLTPTKGFDVYEPEEEIKPEEQESPPKTTILLPGEEDEGAEEEEKGAVTEVPQVEEPPEGDGEKPEEEGAMEEASQTAASQEEAQEEAVEPETTEEPAQAEEETPMEEETAQEPEKIDVDEPEVQKEEVEPEQVADVMEVEEEEAADVSSKDAEEEEAIKKKKKKKKDKKEKKERKKKEKKEKKERKERERKEMERREREKKLKKPKNPFIDDEVSVATKKELRKELAEASLDEEMGTAAPLVSKKKLHVKDSDDEEEDEISEVEEEEGPDDYDSADGFVVENDEASSMDEEGEEEIIGGPVGGFTMQEDLDAEEEMLRRDAEEAEKRGASHKKELDEERREERKRKESVKKREAEALAKKKADMEASLARRRGRETKTVASGVTAVGKYNTPAPVQLVQESPKAQVVPAKKPAVVPIVAVLDPPKIVPLVNGNRKVVAVPVPIGVSPAKLAEKVLENSMKSKIKELFPNEEPVEPFKKPEAKKPEKRTTPYVNLTRPQFDVRLKSLIMEHDGDLKSVVWFMMKSPEEIMKESSLDTYYRQMVKVWNDSKKYPTLEIPEALIKGVVVKFSRVACEYFTGVSSSKKTFEAIVDAETPKDEWDRMIENMTECNRALNTVKDELMKEYKSWIAVIEEKSARAMKDHSCSKSPYSETVQLLRDLTGAVAVKHVEVEMTDPEEGRRVAVCAMSGRVIKNGEVAYLVAVHIQRKEQSKVSYHYVSKLKDPNGRFPEEHYVNSIHAILRFVKLETFMTLQIDQTVQRKFIGQNETDASKLKTLIQTDCLGNVLLDFTYFYNVVRNYFASLSEMDLKLV